jgi:hypothetical protein
MASVCTIRFRFSVIESFVNSLEEARKMENQVEVNAQSTGADLMAAYETHRRNANGEAIGAANDTPAEAVEREGWTVLRAICGGTNCPGTPVLAQDEAERLWVVNDVEGPWAIQVAEAK